MDLKEFLEQVASEVNGDFTFAFKLLGFFVFISQEGSERITVNRKYDLAAHILSVA